MPCRINTSAAWICNALWGGLERETEGLAIVPKYRTILTVITMSSRYRSRVRSIGERRVEGKEIEKNDEEIIFFPPLLRFNF